MTKAFDTIVIGSGIGGLTTALCHAQAGDKVLVLEQHTVPGGWCHSFTLDGYRFNTGVHYIGELEDGARVRSYLEGLGLGADLKFCQLNKQGYEHILFKEQRYDLPNGKDELYAYLVKHFPQEKKGIEQFLNKTEKIAKEIGSILDMEKLSDLLKMPVIAPSMIRWGFSSYDSLVRHYIKDKQLIGLLSAQAGDYAVPPKKAAAPMHVGIFQHYMNGAYYPVGGGLKIPKAYLRALKKYNAEIRLATKVDAILTEGKGKSRQVTGVRITGGEEIKCNKIISNTDPHQTFTHLLDKKSLSKRLQKRLHKTKYSLSCLGLFMAVDLDLKAKGFDSGNYWLFDSNDMNETFRQCSEEELLDKDDFPFFYLTITTLKDPSKKNKNLHAIEAFTYVPFKPFEKWSGSGPEDRSADYMDFKQQLTDKFISNIEKLIPDIRGSIRFSELSTPLTNIFYLNSTKGSIFSTEKNMFQTGVFMFKPKTEIKNLYLCGASTLHGIFGALVSALFTSKISLKKPMKQLLDFKDKEIKIFNSEEMASWPEEFHTLIKGNWGENFSGISTPASELKQLFSGNDAIENNKIIIPSYEAEVE
ncbi:hypothetical protein MNBD_GAMMA23-1303 [hydrothermal vent metagenome]|uniref:Amine oxidase domain-containing protein n=1 Tax=hydrothermal vent metagenome TaxID=652676 RepID=A0A3B0ZT55_9ZZZZ